MRVIMQHRALPPKKEGVHYDKDEVGQAFLMTMEELQSAMAHAKNPDGWATKYLRSALPVIDQMNNLISLFDRMK